MKPDEEVVSLPTHTTSIRHTCGLHRQMNTRRVDRTGPGDNVGPNIKSLNYNKSRLGDAMVYKKNATGEQ